MNTTTFIILSSLTVIFACYIIMLIIRIRTNVLTGQRFHDSLITQISNMRMGRMMDALGINKAKYIHQENVLDIKNHIDSCNSCGNTDQCDDNFNNDEMVVENIHFCENEASMVELVFKQKDKEAQ